MDRKPTILQYLSQIFTTFGITFFLLNIFCTVFGEDAREFSTIFSLGRSGVSVSTAMEFLLAAIITVSLRFLFMTDLIIKKMQTTTRIILMFCSVLVFIIAMTVIFDWFPVKDAKAWIMFGICFIVCCSSSTLVSWINEKHENKKLDDALKKAKEDL